MIKTGGFYEQPGGVIIAPNGRQVLKFDVEQMYLDDYERAMRCVIVRWLMNSMHASKTHDRVS